MAGILPDRKITDALIALLETATGKLIGDVRAPEPTTDDDPDYPYAVVINLGRVQMSGSIAAPHADVAIEYQVTSVGKDRIQADWMADAVREAILGRDSGGYTNDLAGTGWRCVGREPSMEGGVVEGGQLMNRPERFVLHFSAHS